MVELKRKKGTQKDIVTSKIYIELCWNNCFLFLVYLVLFTFFIIYNCLKIWNYNNKKFQMSKRSPYPYKATDASRCLCIFQLLLPNANLYMQTRLIYLVIFLVYSLDYCLELGRDKWCNLNSVFPNIGDCQVVHESLLEIIPHRTFVTWVEHCGNKIII